MQGLVDVVSHSNIFIFLILFSFNHFNPSQVYNSLIFIFLKQTLPPWSCNNICPLAASPKFCHFLYLLIATSLRNSLLPRSYSRTLIPFSQCSTCCFFEIIRAV